MSATTLDGTRGKLHVIAGPQSHDQWAALLITHGLGEHSGSYYHLQDTLNRAGIRWWAYDQRGHGRSDGTPVLIESGQDLIEDCAMVYSKTVATTSLPKAMFGHSLGAGVTVAAARTTQPDALILSALGAQPGTGFAALAAAVAAGIDPITLGADPLTLTQNVEHATFVRGDPYTWQQGIRQETLDALGAGWLDLSAAAAEPAMPTLLVHGDQDSLSAIEGARRYAADGATVTLREFPGDLHNVIHEHDRDEVERVMLDFLNVTLRGLPG